MVFAEVSATAEKLAPLGCWDNQSPLAFVAAMTVLFLATVNGFDLRRPYLVDNMFPNLPLSLGTQPGSGG